MPTAAVTLTVASFDPSTGATTISQPVITDTGGNRLRLAFPNDSSKFGLIATGKGSAPLSIAFTIPGWTPGNISFAKKSPTDPDPVNDFGSQSIDGSTVTVTDWFSHAVLPGGTLPAWEYSIPISKTVGSTNILCVIDPEIDNELQN